MEFKRIELPAVKSIALVAHDNKKPDLLAWCKTHKATLAQHRLYATGTTGNLIAAETGLELKALISGPLGGDQQIGSLITEGQVNMLVFFWDPFEPMPHDPDVKALLRIAAVWNIPVACNESSADFMITSPLFNGPSSHSVPDYEAYIAQRSTKA
jgi:methylglyoxal synthase